MSKLANTESIGLYVHIPFCKKKCVYCDFNTFAGIEHLINPLVDAMAVEIAIWGKALKNTKIKTIFFGGGTPSYIPLKALAQIKHALEKAFHIEETAEITMEANPDDITRQKVQHWRNLGFNRISMGVQALDNDLLKQMGRRHSAEQAAKSFQILNEGGFDNLSFDLIYGWPGQTKAQWRSTLKQVLEWKPKHISLYSLQVEPNTYLNTLVKKGRVAKPNDDLMADMYELADATLEARGISNYEISNWAQTGYECHHNLIYWSNRDYLGIGAGAHSSIANVRFANIKSPTLYIKKADLEGNEHREGTDIFKNRLIQSRNNIGKDERMAETAILGLRLRTGVSYRDFYNRFNRNLTTLYAEPIAYFKKLGLLNSNETHLYLTQRGRLLSNEIFARLLKSSPST